MPTPQLAILQVLIAAPAHVVSSPPVLSDVAMCAGSNSVNVFLGLGLPWFIAAIYWAATTDEEVIFEWKERYFTMCSAAAC